MYKPPRYVLRQVGNMLFCILQATTASVVEYSKERTQESLSSWAAVNDHDIEEERFEIYSLTRK